jgi:hypothetical protein
LKQTLKKKRKKKEKKKTLKDNEKIVNRETLPLKLSEKTTKSTNGD